MSTSQLRRDKLRLTQFGRELVKAREKQNWTQFKLAAELDLAGTGPLVEWEKGRRRPQIASLVNLSRTLELTYSEEVYWRGLTGYLPPTEIPSQTQIKEGLTPYSNHISSYPHPAYIIDNRFHYWVVNMPVGMLVGSTDRLLELLTNKITIFQAIFDSRLGILQQVQNIESIQLEQIRRFKGVNFFRRHEGFYQDYPECMRETLNPNDYKIFKQRWSVVHNLKNNFNIDEYMLSQHTDSVLGQVNYHVGKHKIQFQLTSEVLYSFGNIFTLVRYMPMSTSKYDVPPNTKQPNGCFALWDCTDVESILDYYRNSS